LKASPEIREGTMTLLENRPVGSPIPDVDVLFEEARRRRRRRRLHRIGVGVVIGGILVGLIGVNRSNQKVLLRHQGDPLTSASRPHGLAAGSVVALRHAGPLAVNSSGELYVADDSRDEILVRLASGKFRIAAGDGASGFAGDGGPATRAELSNVSDMAFAPNGDLYIADGGRVRVIDRQGRIETVAGNGASGGPVVSGTAPLSAPLGSEVSIAFSPGGVLYVASLSQLFHLDPAGMLDAIPVVVSSGPRLGAFGDFRQIAVDAQGNVYASSLYSGWSMFKISPTGVATYLGYDRRSGGNAAVVERGPHNAIEADNGADIVRVMGNRLAVSASLEKAPGVDGFIFTDYFAIGRHGVLYADDLGPPAFERTQEIISVSHGRAVSLWHGRARK
jgi:hypothetical protein